MSDIAKLILAISAIAVVALAMSTSKEGARVVQGMLLVLIVAVVLKNEPNTVGVVQNLFTRVTTFPNQQTNPGGN